MVFCTYCGQSFSRNEHLERHILTHTNVKPFRCPVCHVSFRRRDLLRKHSASHGAIALDLSNSRPSDALGPNLRSTLRTQNACVNCAKMKTRCDDKFPCTRCTSKNLPCVLRTNRRSQKNAPRQRKSISSLTNNNSSGDEEGSLLAVPSAAMSMGEGDDSRTHDDAEYQRTEYDNIYSQNDSHPSDPGGSMTQQQHELGQVGPGSMYPPGPEFADSYDYMQYNEQGHTPWGPPPFDMIVPSPLRDHVGSVPNLPMESPSLETGRQGQSAFPGFSPQTMLGSNAPAAPQLTNGVASPQKASSREEMVAFEHQAVTIAQDYWCSFKCGPPVNLDTCPKTAKVQLESLEDGAKVDDPVGSSAQQSIRPPRRGDITTIPLHESTRDKFLAISQSFLQLALHTHSLDFGSRKSDHSSPSADKSSGFLTLPPASMLDFFFLLYVHEFDLFYPMISSGVFDPNSLMQSENNRTSSLLILLILAQSAMTIPTPEARRLFGGLTEVCRISLFETIEKDIHLAKHPLVLHCGMMYIIQATWSGDKWQMDIGMGQRGIYVAMVRHGGMIERSEPSLPVPRNYEDHAIMDHAWKAWLQREHQIRLLYTWILVDQEISVFHDKPPMILITELEADLPDVDELWTAGKATEWHSILVEKEGHAAAVVDERQIVPSAQPSLFALFQTFLDNDNSLQHTRITPLWLRLLLHPIQGLAFQLSQLLSCLPDKEVACKASRPITKNSIIVRLEEVQCLLDRWHNLARRYEPQFGSNPMISASYIIYHLIQLNTMVFFPDIEAFARRCHDAATATPGFQRSRYKNLGEELLEPCGQIIYHLCLLPKVVRPPWWTAAVYRVALILWMRAIHKSRRWPHPYQVYEPPIQNHQGEMNSQLDYHGSNGGRRNLEPIFRIDISLPNYRLRDYLQSGTGVPAFIAPDGKIVDLNDPRTVMRVCVAVIDEGQPTRFAEGIRRRLCALMSLS